MSESKILYPKLPDRYILFAWKNDSSIAPGDNEKSRHAHYGDAVSEGVRWLGENVSDAAKFQIFDIHKREWSPPASIVFTAKKE